MTFEEFLCIGISNVFFLSIALILLSKIWAIVQHDNALAFSEDTNVVKIDILGREIQKVLTEANLMDPGMSLWTAQERIRKILEMDKEICRIQLDDPECYNRYLKFRKGGLI